MTAVIDKRKHHGKWRWKVQWKSGAMVSSNNKRASGLIRKSPERAGLISQSLVGMFLLCVVAVMGEHPALWIGQFASAAAVARSVGREASSLKRCCWPCRAGAHLDVCSPLSTAQHSACFNSQPTRRSSGSRPTARSCWCRTSSAKMRRHFSPRPFEIDVSQLRVMEPAYDL